MNIGLDFDDTYTRHPAMWDKVVKIMRSSGHKVYVVTWRYGGDPYNHAYDESDDVYQYLGDKVDGIFFTGRKAKQAYMYGQCIDINVWIDDNPTSILHTMEGC